MTVPCELGRRALSSPKEVHLTLALDNVLDSDAITDNAGASALGPKLVNVLPRRNIMLSAVALL